MERRNLLLPPHQPGTVGTATAVGRHRGDGKGRGTENDIEVGILTCFEDLVCGYCFHGVVCP